MSANITIMEIGVLLAEFSALPDSERRGFLHKHPQLQSAPVVDWALTAARMRGRLGEPEAKNRYARAAFYIASQLGDSQRQATAQEILAER